jgi:hypothetical protein
MLDSAAGLDGFEGGHEMGWVNEITILRWPSDLW